MISDKEARKVALMLRQYCRERSTCKRCVIENSCIDEERPAHWYIEPEYLPDDERDFAKQLLNNGYVYIHIDFDADGRHVEAYGYVMPCKILRADDFPSLIEPANYMLSTLANGYIDGYV